MKTATVQFCGAGGTSEAARMAGIQIVAAINHSKIAIATHKANHPSCTHYQQDITKIDPDDVVDSDLLLTSPCCTNQTPANGKVKHLYKYDLLGERLYDPLDEKSRNTMEDVVRFAVAKKRSGNPYKIIVVENVVEVVKWRKYAAWLSSLTALGYDHQNLYWNTQFFGVPQSRDRVYMVFWLRDLPTPPLEHRPSVFCDACNLETQAMQSWKNLLRWGNYREQYTYHCSRCDQEVTPSSIAARSLLNLNNVGRPIGGRIVATIQANIARGIKRLPGQPFLYGYYSHPVYRRLNEPVGTITTVDRWALITPAQRIEETMHRMLSVQEVKACMGFPSHYQVLGTQKEQIWQLGNAVCPPIMADILTRCLAVFATPGQEKNVRTVCSNR